MNVQLPRRLFTPLLFICFTPHVYISMQTLIVAPQLLLVKIVFQGQCSFESMDINLVFKALVDKEKEVVIFADANREFIHLLSSFLTKPVGTIISLISKQQEEVVEIVCIKNLLESVKNLDDRYFCTEACKTMLLSPQSACSSLKYKLQDESPLSYYVCGTCSSSFYNDSSNRLVSHYSTAFCPCGNVMNDPTWLKHKVEAPTHEGVLVRPSHLIVTDELKLVSPAAILSLVPENRMVDGVLIEQTLTLGSNEVSKLLKCLLTSQQSLTETFLKPSPSAQSGNKPSAGSLGSCVGVDASNTYRKITISLWLSESKKMACFATAQEDFVNLLFSFLTLPLSYVAKKMKGSCFKIGCLDHLYNSFLDTTEPLKLSEHKTVLINPRLAPGYGYENQLLDIEQAEYPRYGYTFDDDLSRILTDDLSDDGQRILTVMDPKIDARSPTKSVGFVRPAKFLILDDLTVTPHSPVSVVSSLCKLKLPFDDVVGRDIHVGEDEAVQLLLASFSSDSVLTNVFVTPEQS